MDYKHPPVLDELVLMQNARQVIIAHIAGEDSLELSGFKMNADGTKETLRWDQMVALLRTKEGV